MLEGGPRGRVGTLIRNKNLDSKLLTLMIRFQNLSQLGERFDCITVKNGLTKNVKS